MIITFQKSFTKDFQKFSPKIKDKFKNRLLLLEVDEFCPVLNNHSLRGEYQGYRSINITGDIRAIYYKNGDEAIFVNLGSHSNLYG